jgi:methyl acetate hydrolase
MLDTGVELTDRQRSRSAAVHLRAGQGGWTLQPPRETAAAEFYAGGHCLYSTAVDYLSFQRALLAGGALGRFRILSAESVASMFTNQIGGLALEAAATYNPDLCLDLRFPPGAKWGLGFMLTGRYESEMRPIGSAGWAGVFNTLYWLDPVNRIAAALYTQTLPFRDPAIMHAYDQFEHCLYQQLTA